MVKCQVLQTCLGIGMVLTAAAALAAEAAEPVDFNRDVRPILSNYCFACHGPDANERQGELRLDTAADYLKPAASGRAVIIPGKPDESPLLARIASLDATEVMPPPATNKKLSAADQATLRRWIEQGARFQQHWAFETPQRPAAPAVKNGAWARNAVDRFLLQRLEKEGLEPSPEADRATLIRRLSFDLTGLPPTPAEVDAFVQDTRADAYERLVDRLLADPHYGERLAVDWLDAARFADTHGFHIDSGRDMTVWREWVIDSFNRNLPFDQFTIEQLAGDLLPNATDEQRVASGFNRNHMINFEGGAIPDEYHNAYVVDRVNTLGAVWMGLTVGCAQCHEHKYDPITQRDFYRLYAFFYNVKENGLDGSKGNAMPLLKSPSRRQRQEQVALADRLQQINEGLMAPSAEIDAAQAAWEVEAAKERSVNWSITKPTESTAAGGGTFTVQDDGVLVIDGANPAQEVYTVAFPAAAGRLSGLRLEVFPDDRFAGKGPGRSVNGNFVLTEVTVALRAADGKETPVPLPQAAADFSQQDFAVGNAVDGKADSGWAIHPQVGKPHTAYFAAEKGIELPQPGTVIVRLAFQSGFSQHQFARFRLSVTDAESPLKERTLPESVRHALAVAAGERNAEQTLALRRHYRQQVAPALQPLRQELQAVRQALEQLESQFSTTMIMDEGQPRKTFVRVRGAYDKLGDEVTAGVPEVFPPLPVDAPANRLGLARWLVDARQPLTPRVIVNRYWQMLFGTGLVKTAEDFGSQGERPSHPELLEWLAVEFRQPSPAPLGTGTTTPWDVKALLRLLVTSSAYRQSSAVSPALAARDPENRWLARGPRYRLQAEFIRDLALATSGLLNPEIGGASVSPYQPTGLWEELMSREDGRNWSAQTYTQSHGPDLYKRTMYTFWKRTCPPPSLATFDAPDRETCVVRRARTNTPLQALVLMNDPTYVEASRKLAERLLREAATTEDRVVLLYRLVLSRGPRPPETAIVRRLFEAQLGRYRDQPVKATELLSVGESPRDEDLPAVDVAAWAMTASAVLNLDEAVTRN